jgi:hypothetical protein
LSQLDRAQQQSYQPLEEDILLGQNGHLQAQIALPI